MPHMPHCIHVLVGEGGMRRDAEVAELAGCWHPHRVAGLVIVVCRPGSFVRWVRLRFQVGVDSCLDSCLVLGDGVVRPRVVLMRGDGVVGARFLMPHCIHVLLGEGGMQRDAERARTPCSSSHVLLPCSSSRDAYCPRRTRLVVLLMKNYYIRDYIIIIIPG